MQQARAEKKTGRKGTKVKNKIWEKNKNFGIYVNMYMNIEYGVKMLNYIHNSLNVFKILNMLDPVEMS